MEVKRVKVVMLPTEDESHIGLVNNSKLEFFKHYPREWHKSKVITAQYP